VAEVGEGAASGASEWEDREREKQLALLRQDERLGGDEQADSSFPFGHSLFLLFLCLYFVTHLLAANEREVSTRRLWGNPFFLFFITSFNCMRPI